MPRTMQRRLAFFGALSLLGAGLGLSRCHRPASEALSAAEAVTSGDAPEALKAAPAQDAPKELSRDEAVSGLDVLHVTLDDDGARAPAAKGRTAKLTLDPRLQKTAQSLMQSDKLPEAAIVMVDVKTGAVLVYASHVESGPARDLCAEAKAPSASVFKVVTASALVEHAGLGAETRQCYAGGGDQRVTQGDLDEDPLRDKWCPSLATAMGKSTNTVFARLASKHLEAHTLRATAGALGYGDPVPFDLPNEASAITLPEDKLGFARTAAGFWNTTLSPLEAVMLSAAVAHEGEPMRPFLVSEVTDERGETVFRAPDPAPLRRALKRETALALTTMMEHTVSEGTSYRAFHDPRGKAFLPGETVAGKTGTLNDPDGVRFYSWFTGFAPSHARADEAQVAVAVLVVNHAKWRVKANVIAREMLRAYKGQSESEGAVASRAK